MKKATAILLSVITMCGILGVFASAENESQMPVDVKAKSAVLMDQSTGTVLMRMNENEKLYPASVTKIMSMLLVAEAIDSNTIRLTDAVTTSTNASKKGGSQIWLKEGETMTVDELLKATAVYSANDACTALGEYIAGSDEAFVTMMNDRAQELGMKNTHFDNCTNIECLILFRRICGGRNHPFFHILHCLINRCKRAHIRRQDLSGTSPALENAFSSPVQKEIILWLLSLSCKGYLPIKRASINPGQYAIRIRSTDIYLYLFLLSGRIFLRHPYS